MLLSLPGTGIEPALPVTETRPSTYSPESLSTSDDKGLLSDASCHAPLALPTEPANPPLDHELDALRRSIVDALPSLPKDILVGWAATVRAVPGGKP